MKNAHFTRLQSIEGAIPDPVPDQAKGREPHGCRHPAYLPVFSFRQFETNPGGRNIFPEPYRRLPFGYLGCNGKEGCLAGFCLVSFSIDGNPYTFLQLLQRGCCDAAIYLYPVFACMGL